MSKIVKNTMRAIFCTLFLLVALVALLAFGPWIGISSTANAILTVVAGFVFVLLHGGSSLGWKNIIAFLTITIGISFFAEAFGVATGVVFGRYHYTGLLGPKILGVPPMIQLAYAAMGYCSLMIARVILRVADEPPDRRSLIAVSLTGTFIMVSWDVVMDPFQSTVAGDWLWKDGGPYFGIGIHNYAGWFATVFSFMFVYQLYATFCSEHPSDFARSRIFLSLPVLYYASVALSIVVVPWVGGISLPYASPENYHGTVTSLSDSLALIAFFLMGFPVVAALAGLIIARPRVAAVLAAAAVLSTGTLRADLPYGKILWPADDRPHLSNTRVVSEWWYFTGKLTATSSGQTRHFGYYIMPQYLRDITGQVPILYLQITDIETGKVYGGNIPLPDVRLSPVGLDITSRNFHLKGNNGTYTLSSKVTLEGKILGLHLTLVSRKPPLLIGPNPAQRGLVTMGNQTNTYYYSLTHLDTSGTLQIGDKKYAINPDPRFSRSWMDHQWGDFSIPQVVKSNPWIWFAVQLADGTDMNIGEFVRPGTSTPLWPSLANISRPDGAADYQPASVTVGPVKGQYPRRYTVKIGDHLYHMDALVPDQNKNGVWMGIMSINGRSIAAPNGSFATAENTTLH